MARDFDADLKSLDQLQRDLKLFSEKSVPFAMRNALNDTAFLGRKLWQKEMRESFTLRNTFTTRSVRVVKVGRGSNVAQMFVVVGSLSPYMGLQEDGGVQRGRSGVKPIPTSVAAGQPLGSQPRTKVVRRPNRMRNINLDRRIRKGTKAQRNAANVRQAARLKRKFAIIEREGGKTGIVRVTGRKKLNVKLIWDLSRTSVRIKPRPTLQPVVAKLERLAPAIHRRAIIKELRFRRISGF